MANTITLLLTAKDQISGSLRSWVPQWKAQATSGAAAIGAALSKGFSGMGSPLNGRKVGQDTADGLRQGLQGVNLAELIGASAAGNLIASGITGAINLGLNQITNFQAAVGNAAAIQSSMVVASSELSQTLGISMAQASMIVRDTRQEIAQLAASLPGETSDYSEVFQSIAGTIGEFNRGNLEQFQEDVLALTRGIGFLANSSGSGGFEAGAVVERFINGSATFGELKGNDVFQKNSLFVKSIERASAQLGLDLEDGFKNASSELRLKVIKQALETTVTDDLIKAFDSTAEGYLQTLKTKLLDPDLGLFGFLRKVPVPGSEGRSVIDAVTTFLGNFVRLGDALGSLFPGVDPLLPLIQFIDWLSGVTGGLTLFLQKMRPGSLGLSEFELDTNGIFTTISDWLIGLVQQLNPLIDQLGSVLSQIDWSALGDRLVDVTWLALGALGSVLAALDWGAIGQLLYRSVLGVIELLASAVGSAIGKLLDGVLLWIEDLTGQSTDGIRSLAGAVTRWIAGIAEFFSRIPVIGGMIGSTAAGANSLANQIDPAGVNPGKSLPGTGSGLADTLAPKIPQAIPPAQLTPDGSGLPGLPMPKLQTNQSTVFSPQISVTGTNLSDPQGTADVVLAALGSKFATYQSTVLSK